MTSVSKIIGQRVPFAELLGIQVTERTPGRARLDLELRQEHMNGWHTAHGGVVMALADVTLAVAAISSDPAATGAMTVDLSVSFVGPGKGRLVAHGRCVKSGKTLAFAEGEIVDAEGKLVAKALGTFTLRRGARGPGDGIRVAVVEGGR